MDGQITKAASFDHSTALFQKAKEAQEEVRDIQEQIKGLQATPEKFRESRLADLHQRRRDKMMEYCDAIDELDRRKLLPQIDE